MFYLVFYRDILNYITTCKVYLIFFSFLLIIFNFFILEFWLIYLTFCFIYMSYWKIYFRILISLLSKCHLKLDAKFTARVSNFTVTIIISPRILISKLRKSFFFFMLKQSFIFVSTCLSYEKYFTMFYKEFVFIAQMKYSISKIFWLRLKWL